ncbi:MAG: hypothetical protein ACX93U_11985 [Salipiger thiooxidans]|uniref:hypothetical protein n=1 Tax=Salipiger thiooxidans TaxID=282683 RepID=UPI001CFB813F|nr:hypothetical protein [Salipiger thiooxidans]
MADDRLRRGAALVMVAVGLWRAALTEEAGLMRAGLSVFALIGGLCGLTCLRAERR